MEIEQLSTDSRRIAFPATTLFFALQTERRDAHMFIPELYKRGVKNFVVIEEFNTGEFKGANFLFCANTLEALQKLAAYHRKQFNYPVIGITGSSGKTIIKEWLYQLLSPDFNIVRSPRSYNSQVGVPLSVWQMNETYNLAIFEAGISMPGEMAKLAGIIRPTLGIFANIGAAHSEGFENDQEKVEEKIQLFKGTSAIIWCADHALVNEVLTNQSNAGYLVTGKRSSGEFSWGSKENALVKIIGEKQKDKTIVTLSYDNERKRLIIPFTDDASVENALHCYCACFLMNLSHEAIAERMLQLQPVEMRLQLLHAINNCVVINDSYSFDISSFATALDFLSQQQQLVQKTAIISDIPAARDEHAYQQVVSMLEAKHIYRLITIGPEWGRLNQLWQNRFAVTQHFDDTNSFIKNFSSNHFRNEAILLKAARLFEFEKIATLLEKKVHQTVLEIDLTAIIHNLNQYRSRLNKGVKIMAMVKAFAYGSGSPEIASLLQFHKVEYLAVAYADEGVELRKAGISLPIMVMNVDHAAFETLIQYNLEPELFSFGILKSFIVFLERQGLQQYPVHIKLDTGMHRLGFEQTDMEALSTILQQQKQVAVQSVFSHLAASEDAAEDAFTKHQSATFEACCVQIKAAIGYSFTRHISNTAAIFRNPALQYDMVRLGIGLYGIDSVQEKQPGLQTAATLKTTIAQLRKVKAGDTIGYNRRGKTIRDSLIATIRIGYADGFSRKLGLGNGKVFIRGKMAPVIGSVCMDMTMVDVTGIDDVREEDEVEIFGKHISVQEVAAWCGTIPYEVLTGISQRVKRVYIEA